MRTSIFFIGEENKVNNELYQLFNWRFKVAYYNQVDSTILDDLDDVNPGIIVVSMLGNTMGYHELFESFAENYEDIPVITISTKEESNTFNDFYQKKQFHRILRPVTGKRVIEICKAVIDGNAYEEEQIVDSSNEKKHILVVDDNAMILRNIKGILEESYSVAVAPSGFHALVSAGKKIPDLILLDYEMPEMNGKEVLKKLQMDDDLKEVPVVFLTSVDTREIVMELLALKPAGYILKPVDSQMILGKIEELIGK